MRILRYVTHLLLLSCAQLDPGSQPSEVAVKANCTIAAGIVTCADDVVVSCGHLGDGNVADCAGAEVVLVTVGGEVYFASPSQVSLSQLSREASDALVSERVSDWLARRRELSSPSPGAGARAVAGVLPSDLGDLREVGLSVASTADGKLAITNLQPRWCVIDAFTDGVRPSGVSTWYIRPGAGVREIGDRIDAKIAELVGDPPAAEGLTDISLPESTTELTAFCTAGPVLVTTLAAAATGNGLAVGWVSLAPLYAIFATEREATVKVGAASIIGAYARELLATALDLFLDVFDVPDLLDSLGFDCLAGVLDVSRAAALAECFQRKGGAEIGSCLGRNAIAGAMALPFAAADAIVACGDESARLTQRGVLAALGRVALPLELIESLVEDITGLVLYDRWVAVDVPACRSDGDCDDGTVCDGAEICREGRCVEGAPESCARDQICDRLSGCIPDPGCVPETCNGRDDDCDGAMDEGFSGLGTACDSSDADQCALGVLVCAADGAATECSERVHRSEVCGNGVDEDCIGGDLPCAAGTVTSTVVDPVPEGACVDDELAISIVARNDGPFPWTNSGVGVSDPNYVEVRAVDAQGTEVESPYYHQTWINRVRVGAPSEPDVRPAGHAVFTFPARVPGPTTGYFAVFHATGGRITSPVAVTAATDACDRPASPTGLTALYDSGAVWLHWDIAPATLEYEVYWGTSPGLGLDSEFAGSTPVEGFAHSGVDRGATYYYAIRGHDGRHWSELSDEVSVAVPQLATPENLRAHVSGTDVWLTWSAAPEAMEYLLYWGTSPGVTEGSEQAPATTTTEFLHSDRVPGATYYYRIAATDGRWTSALSGEVSAWVAEPPDDTGPWDDLVTCAREPDAVRSVFQIVGQDANADDTICGQTCDCQACDGFGYYHRAGETDGLRVHVSLAELVDSDGAPDFERLEARLAAASCAAGRVVLSVDAVQPNYHGAYNSFPEAWAGEVPALTYAIPGEDIQPTRVPVLWHPAYLDRLDALVSALGQRYDGDPRLARLLVSYGTWGELVFDLRFHRADGAGDLSHADAREAWLQAGFSEQVWLDAAEAISQSYQRAFPTTPLVAQLTDVGARMLHDPSEFAEEEAAAFPHLSELLEAFATRAIAAGVDELQYDGLASSARYGTDHAIMRVLSAFSGIVPIHLEAGAYSGDATLPGCDPGDGFAREGCSDPDALACMLYRAQNIGASGVSLWANEWWDESSVSLIEAWRSGIDAECEWCSTGAELRDGRLRVSSRHCPAGTPEWRGNLPGMNWEQGPSAVATDGWYELDVSQLPLGAAYEVTLTGCANDVGWADFFRWTGTCTEDTIGEVISCVPAGCNAYFYVGADGTARPCPDATCAVEVDLPPVAVVTGRPREIGLSTSYLAGAGCVELVGAFPGMDWSDGMQALPGADGYALFQLPESGDSEFSYFPCTSGAPPAVWADITTPCGHGDTSGFCHDPDHDGQYVLRARVTGGVVTPSGQVVR
jgi:hypothetical protein